MFVTLCATFIPYNDLFFFAGIQKDSSFIQVYPVSNGGIHAAQTIQAEFYGLFPFLWDDGSFTGGGLDLVDSPGSAQVFIDDLIETGETRKNYYSAYPEIPFLSLVDKLGQDQDIKDERIQFPWNSRFLVVPGSKPLDKHLRSNPFESFLGALG